MASRAWQPDDLEVFKALSIRRDWLPEALARFPDRTVASVRWMMQRARVELGTTDSRFVDNAWMADAANGSRRLFDALQRTGLRPS